MSTKQLGRRSTPAATGRSTSYHKSGSRDRDLHASRGPPWQGARGGLLRSRSRVVGKRRGGSERRTRGRGGLDGRTLLFLAATLLLRGVHSTPDSLSERSTVWGPPPSWRNGLHLFLSVSLTLSIPSRFPPHYCAANYILHITGESEIQISASQEKKIKIKLELQYSM